MSLSSRKASRKAGESDAASIASAPDARDKSDGRGSASTIEKRRAARAFNSLLLGGELRQGDGRTERKRRRLLDELEEGASRRGKRALKPIDVLSRAQALLELGEPLASIRKACGQVRPVAPSQELLDGLTQLHKAYGFSPDAYRLLGFDDATLRRAGVLDPARPLRRAAPPARPQGAGLARTRPGSRSRSASRGGAA